MWGVSLILCRLTVKTIANTIPKPSQLFRAHPVQKTVDVCTHINNVVQSITELNGQKGNIAPHKIAEKTQE